jgi:hypothetical protein
MILGSISGQTFEWQFHVKIFLYLFFHTTIILWSHVKIECFCSPKLHQHIFEFHLNRITLNKMLILFKSFNMISWVYWCDWYTIIFNVSIGLNFILQN